MSNNKLQEKIKKHKDKKKEAKRNKNPKLSSRLLIFIPLALLVAVAVFFGIRYIIKSEHSVSETVENLVEDVSDEDILNEVPGGKVIEHIIVAGLATQEAFNLRPPMVELTDENRDNFVDITSCKIDDKGMVRLDFESDGIPVSDDKLYYLFDINSYDDNFTLGEDYLAKCYKNDEASLSCALLANSASSRLYKRFTVAVKVDGKFVPVSHPKFITNPEVIAPYKDVYMTPSSKKGILIDYNRVFTGQLEDLGVKQIAINIPISSIMGPTTNPLFPSIHYTYNGKNYTFNGVIVAGFDSTVSAMTSRGIQTTAILLNDYSYAYNNLIHPDARSAGVCPYYMFNGSTDEGVELLSAVGSFLAERYSGSKHGRISNWVIANEINARKEWNYLKYTDVDTYSKEFAKGFRVLYTAIKSTSSTGRVYISLDQTWDRNLTNSPDYDGKDVLDSFNSYITEYGNIDWSLAYHPYNVPLTSTKTWASSKYINHTSTSPMISMQNIDVLVNYMNGESMLNPNGECRSIMITELGYTSSGGEQNQAAAIAYAFYKIDHYKDIDGLLLNRQTDDATEIAQGLATGITTAGGGLKYSYNVYKYMDTAEREKYTEFAKPIIGISDWKQIIY